MLTNETFCESCRKDVVFRVEPLLMSEQLKGENFEFEGNHAMCSECGEEVYVARIEDENLKALYDAYRNRHGIISQERIIGIPQKYAIGKRPLSLLLGWGELTFTRYCEGDMPTKQYAEVLQKLDEDPGYYLKLLEKNKEHLKSTISYEKSKRRTLELLTKGSFLSVKLERVIHYVLNQCEDITPLALQKVLYYLQGFYYAFEQRFLFDDDCEAWVHGPVYRNVYDKYASYRFDPIARVAQIDDSFFTSSEKAILDSIIRYLCCYSGKTLERFTHLEQPWLQARDGLAVDAHSNALITKTVIGNYFVAVKEKHQMLTPGDIGVYAKTLFEQIN